MRSRLLEKVAPLVVPLAGLLAFALLLKGHDQPGGGFVAGLALAVAGILAILAYGPAEAARRLGRDPERFALAGVAVLLLTLIWPLAGGHPALTHPSGTLPLLGKWHGALLFDIGVTMAVGGGATAAARRLWQQPRRPRGGRG